MFGSGQQMTGTSLSFLLLLFLGRVRSVMHKGYRGSMTSRGRFKREGRTCATQRCASDSESQQDTQVLPTHPLATLDSGVLGISPFKNVAAILQFLHHFFRQFPGLVTRGLNKSLHPWFLAFLSLFSSTRICYHPTGCTLWRGLHYMSHSTSCRYAWRTFLSLALYLHDVLPWLWNQLVLVISWLTFSP